jgi:DNA-binding CsgD family transcriptional regulator
MAKNNHSSIPAEREKLDIKLFSQPFSGFVNTDLSLQDCQLIAGLYAKLENTISVLSDMQSRKSYIYTGGLAAQLGFAPSQHEIHSIWEDELLGKVHPEDLQRKYRLEFTFFQLMKSIKIAERVDYNLITRLRIKDDLGKYHVVRHRLLYLSSTQQGDVWLALCLYHTVYEHPGFDVPEGVILNTRTGLVLESEQDQFEDMLSDRELQVLQLINQGLRSKEIGGELSLSTHTVNRHRQNIFQKLNVSNAMEACRLAQATGLLR